MRSTDEISSKFLCAVKRILIHLAVSKCLIETLGVTMRWIALFLCSLAATCSPEADVQNVSLSQYSGKYAYLPELCTDDDLDVRVGDFSFTERVGESERKNIEYSNIIPFEFRTDIIPKQVVHLAEGRDVTGRSLHSLFVTLPPNELIEHDLGHDLRVISYMAFSNLGPYPIQEVIDLIEKKEYQDPTMLFKCPESMDNAAPALAENINPPEG